MNIVECLHTNSRGYKAAQESKPVGIVVHSTGSNNMSLKRYVQPSTDDLNYNQLIELLGKNKNGNHWNRNVKKSVHYFIGKLASGDVATAHVLPEEFCAWGVGKGKKGSYNYNPTAHIQFEVCEDALTSETYFNSIYKEAAELCADICHRHGWDTDVIVSHKEAYKLGYASKHKDINHWLEKFGFTMNDFRTEVQSILDKLNGSIIEPYEPKIGDVVNYVGTVHYSNANSNSPKTCKPGEATVTSIYKGKHPYQLINTSGDKDGVYGWVDGKYINKIEKSENITTEDDVSSFEEVDVNLEEPDDTVVDSSNTIKENPSNDESNQIQQQPSQEDSSDELEPTQQSAYNGIFMKILELISLLCKAVKKLFVK